MKKLTINRLNQLNQKFYEIVAEEFNETRSKAWDGWEKFLEIIASKKLLNFKQKLFVLDIGCGNGRFANFLLSKNIKLGYLGIDANQKLLNKGLQQELFQNDEDNLRLEKFDVVENLLEIEGDEKGMDFGEFDLTVAFGVLHHLPSLELRKKFMRMLAAQIDEDGMVVVTAWRFDRDENLLKRQLNFSDFDFETNEIESGDYLLDWQRGEKAVRFCHLVLPKEMDELIKAAGLVLIETFTCDGKSNNLNDYYLCKKQNKSTLSL